MDVWESTYAFWDGAVLLTQRKDGIVARAVRMAHFGALNLKRRKATRAKRHVFKRRSAQST